MGITSYTNVVVGLPAWNTLIDLTSSSILEFWLFEISITQVVFLPIDFLICFGISAPATIFGNEFSVWSIISWIIRLDTFADWRYTQSEWWEEKFSCSYFNDCLNLELKVYLNTKIKSSSIRETFFIEKLSHRRKLFMGMFSTWKYLKNDKINHYYKNLWRI